MSDFGYDNFKFFVDVEVYDDVLWTNDLDSGFEFLKSQIEIGNKSPE